MILHRRHLLAITLVLPLAAAWPAQAEIESFYAPGGVAIGGYDAVAYFTNGQAQPGSDQFMLKWRGAIWMFSTAANLEAFEMDPLAYAPQYGGYCAMAAARGQAASSDPRAFSIHGGRLYLNSNATSQHQWQSDAARMISRADAAWPQLSGR